MYIRNSSGFQNGVGLTVVGGSVLNGATAENTTFEGNKTANISISGAHAALFLINSVVEHSVGISESGSPTVFSNGKNSVFGGGAITSTIPVE